MTRLLRARSYAAPVPILRNRLPPLPTGTFSLDSRKDRGEAGLPESDVGYSSNSRIRSYSQRRRRTGLGVQWMKSKDYRAIFAHVVRFGEHLEWDHGRSTSACSALYNRSGQQSPLRGRGADRAQQAGREPRRLLSIAARDTQPPPRHRPHVDEPPGRDQPARHKAGRNAAP